MIIFDEIQECPDALNSFKYFKAKANEYHVISAGSLLGAILAQPKFCPVRMVNLLEASPLKFDEFLRATDENLYQYYERINKKSAIEEYFHTRLTDACNYYFIIGGMPEAVVSWRRYKDPVRISRIQRDLVEVYEHDFQSITIRLTVDEF